MQRRSVFELARSVAVTKNVKVQVDEMIPALLTAVLPKASFFLSETFGLCRAVTKSRIV